MNCRQKNYGEKFCGIIVDVLGGIIGFNWNDMCGIIKDDWYFGGSCWLGSFYMYCLFICTRGHIVVSHVS